MQKQLHHKARAYRQAEHEYTTAFREYFDNQVAELSDDRFWALQAVFHGEVMRFRFSYRRTNGVEQAAREFFRKPLAGDFSGVEYSTDEAICFAKTWRSVSRQLYEPLFDVIQNRGDDGYSDLLDALPLAGRQLVEKALRREFGNELQFDAAVLDYCHGDQRLCQLILHGENYVATSLADSAQEFLALSVEQSVTSEEGTAR